MAQTSGEAQAFIELADRLRDLASSGDMTEAKALLDWIGRGGFEELRPGLREYLAGVAGVPVPEEVEALPALGGPASGKKPRARAAPKPLPAALAAITLPALPAFAAVPPSSAGKKKATAGKAGKAAAAPSSAGKKKGKRAKKAKVPGTPTRPRSAYMYFAQQARPTIVAQFPGITFGDIGKRLGEYWRSLTPAQRAPYERLAAADKQRYAEEKKAFEAKQAAEGGAEEGEGDE